MQKSNPSIHPSIHPHPQYNVQTSSFTIAF
jgi:hypothetical protein